MNIVKPTPEFTKALSKAKVLIMEQPNSAFISTVLFSMKLVITDDPSMPTAGVDGFHLFINPNYFMSQSPSVQKSILFHEAWHLAWNHPQRGKDLDHTKYNIAGDYVINIMGYDAGYEIPDSWYCSAKYRGKSTLEVYNDLPDAVVEKHKKGIAAGGAASNGPGGDVIYSDKPLTKDEKKAAAIQWAGMIQKAAMASKLAKDAPGSIPGEIIVKMEEILNPKLPWNEILQNYMTAYAKDDYSYRKPNRRFWPEFYLPSMFSTAIDHIAVAVDTSGSVTDAEFASFRNEIMGIHENLKPEKLSIMAFDTTLKEVIELDQGDDFAKVEFTGRGGTDIKGPWEWAKKEQPVCIIIFSDMEFTFPTEPTGTDVLWVAVNNPKVKMPFGTAVHLQL